jgi:hypothetical protein
MPPDRPQNRARPNLARVERERELHKLLGGNNKKVGSLHLAGTMGERAALGQLQVEKGQHHESVH